MRAKILSVTPINPLGVTAPLVNKGSRENGVNAILCSRYNPSVGFADSSPCTGEPRMRSVTAVLAAVITPAFGGRTSSVTVQRQGAAPRHLPQGGRLITPSPLCRPAIKMCRHGRHTLTFAPKGQIFHTRGARISPPRSGDFTRRLAAVFHCGAAAKCAAMGGTH